MKSVLIVLSLSALFAAGCSNKLKQRQEQREKVAATSGLFCEFVSGDDHKDVDVELNFQMAKRCDSDKNFTVTSYKSSADVNGLVFCCATKRPEAPARAPKRPTPAPAAPAAAPAPAPVSADSAAPILESED